MKTVSQNPRMHPIQACTVISGHLPAWPITRTGQLLHAAKKKVNRLPTLVDNPHVMLLNFLVAKNMTLR